MNIIGIVNNLVDSCQDCNVILNIIYKEQAIAEIELISK